MARRKSDRIQKRAANGRTRTSRGFRGQKSPSPADSSVVCHCLEGPPENRNVLAVCDLCGTLQHNSCILIKPIKSKHIDATDCFTCCRAEMKEIIAKTDQPAFASKECQNRLTKAGDEAARHRVASGRDSSPLFVASDEEMTQNSASAEETDDVLEHSQHQTRSHMPISPKDSPATENEGIICDCPEESLEDDESGGEGDDLVPCSHCGQHQHAKCMVQVSDHDGFDHLQLCNRCNNRKDRHLCKTRNANAADALNMTDHKRGESHKLYAEDLWKHYCSLPNGSASPEVITATQMQYVRGGMLPVNAAPQAWVEEVQTRVSMMMEAAGDQLANFVMSPETSRPQTSQTVLRQWRALALWMIHHGPYKGKRKELGLLAEVLGLEEKGTN